MGIALNTPISFALGLAVGVLFWLGLCDFAAGLAHLFHWDPPSWASMAGRVVSLPILLLAGGVLGGALAVVVTLVTRLPRHDFGICPGHRAGVGDAAPEPLTDWLHNKINTLAPESIEAIKQLLANWRAEKSE